MKPILLFVGCALICLTSAATQEKSDDNRRAAELQKEIIKLLGDVEQAILQAAKRASPEEAQRLLASWKNVKEGDVRKAMEEIVKDIDAGRHRQAISRSDEVKKRLDEVLAILRGIKQDPAGNLKEILDLRKEIEKLIREQEAYIRELNAIVKDNKPPATDDIERLKNDLAKPVGKAEAPALRKRLEEIHETLHAADRKRAHAFQPIRQAADEALALAEKASSPEEKEKANEKIRQSVQGIEEFLKANREPDATTK